MSRTLLSPRTPVQTLGDFGERSAFVAGQRVGRPRRRRRPLAIGRFARRAVIVLLLAVIPAAGGLGGWWFLTSPRFFTRGR